MRIRKTDGTYKEIIYTEKQLLQYGYNRLSTREYGREKLRRRMLR